VHYSPQHLAANLAGCAVVAAFGTAARLPARAIVAAAAAWPLTQILLLWAPSLSRYAGLSGVLHAAVAVAAVALVVGGARRQRWIGAAVWLGLLVKVALEAPWAGAVQTVPGWDIPVAVAAHASGLISGSFMMGLVALYAASRSSTPRPRQSV
jgi:rhomboid family GlyGly-CTERM serine protease